MKRIQAGFSLVELMVALLLGTLVTLAAVQLLGTNQRTFRLQQALTDVQEQGRFAVDYMKRDVYRLGYVDVDATGTPLSTGVGVQTAATTVNGVTFSASADDDDGNGNDRLTFTYYGTEDCEGDTAAEGLIADTYWLSGSDLKCMGSVSSTTTGVVLVSGVDSFQVLYGIDTNQDKVAFADQYVKPTAIGAHTVVAVRLGLLVRSDATQPDAGTPESFIVLDKTLTGGTDLTDDKVRRLFTATVKVRNYDWEAI